MVSDRLQNKKKNPNGVFFFFTTTFIMWVVSIFFEISFHSRTELLPLIAGFFFYQIANWVCRNFISRDPILVNTCVSLLHSSITSASGCLVFHKRSIQAKVYSRRGWRELG